jgi:pimeloyl-ACP methyl ester carboxylesterase
MFTGTLPETVNVLGANIQFAQMGSGQSLLYLHGCDGIDVDDSFISPLIQHFSVTAPALPGFGMSDLPQGLSNTGELAEFCIEIARQLSLENCVLCGNSFGGWLAAEMAIRRSGLFAKLVLVDALGARFTSRPDEREIYDLFTIPTSEYPYAYFSDRTKADTAFGRMDFKSLPEGSALRYCRNREALTQFGWTPLLHSQSLRRRLALINIPTLVLWGEDDRVVAPAYGRRYAEAIPGAQFEMVAGAGHYLPMEQPVAFVERIVAFAGRPS